GVGLLVAELFWAVGQFRMLVIGSRECAPTPTVRGRHIDSTTIPVGDTESLFGIRKPDLYDSFRFRLPKILMPDSKSSPTPSYRAERTTSPRPASLGRVGGCSQT